MVRVGGGWKSLEEMLQSKINVVRDGKAKSAPKRPIMDPVSTLKSLRKVEHVASSQNNLHDEILNGCTSLTADSKGSTLSLACK